ncbi:DNA polymerase III subunit gamma/tau [Acetanaerobacterium elongatum]|uniref:DNA-directed DNA polymerase n=1 Tax=Acetanaerobacterium elongatum TaxID=258515 RepID=A0A1G9Y3K8_9FIRM|nr:DNA polymerase III subunit gamma/tau [Acetanaerobacterium elongatum]SDN03597.1 DNA polymerase-3 subunit gamma/tau [Acetanaerobacterium elongatum]
MYKALYRTWRPKTFEDVVGQEHITTTLKNEVVQGKVAHSYLFTGSRGTGKTTCSKILAKAVNCLHPVDGNPCGECEICLGIEDGSVTDVVEIDAASNNGIDDVRALREEAVFTPVSAKYRVYIIDETHMLSIAAFNALLKIMEEPPEHVLFILATTEVHKVPATILSRCQRFDFRRIDTEVIKNRLLAIATGEQITLNEDAAELIARLADGGMRDAISLLDQCATAAEVIDIPVVSKLAALADTQYLYELADIILSKDGARALELVERLNAESVDFARLLSELITLFRNLMVVKGAKKPENLIVCTPDELSQLKGLAVRCPMELTLHVLTVLGDALDGMGKTHSKRLAAEICLMRLTNPELDTGYDALLRRIGELEARVQSGVVSATAASVPHKGVKNSAKQPQGEEPQAELPPPVTREVLEVEEKLKCWNDVLEHLATVNPALHGTMVNSTAYVKGDLILIDAPDSMFTEMMRKNDYTKQSLRDAIMLKTGKIYRLGPVKKNTEIKETGVLLAQLEHAARQAGIEIN